MKSRPELPPKYYLTHFQEFLSEFSQAEHLLRGSEKRFLLEFQALSESAQCLYVRMVNRKGRIFSQKEFSYAEIENIDAGFRELRSAGFIRPPNPEDSQDIIQSLKKHQILELLLSAGESVKKSASKPKLIEQALESSLRISEADFGDLIFQEKHLEMEFLLFLYFGKIMEGLSLYTLRDLGIKRMNKYQGQYKPRFETLAEAESHYFYALLSEDVTRAIPLDQWPAPLNAESTELRNLILITLADGCEDMDEAEGYLRASGIHPARERLCRLLWKREKKDDCEILLNEIITEPWEEEEVLFAEDFLQRKFGKRRVSILTERLRSSLQIEVDESYFRHPEIGVIDHLSGLGWTAHHTENHFWNLFFGLLFWEEIFCHPDSHFRNSFELLPADLLNGSFYANHEKAIEDKLQNLENPEWTAEFIKEVARVYHEDQLGIFSWDEASLELLLHGLGLIQPEAQRTILRAMAKNYVGYSAGFPDLVAFRDNEIKFIEVKATGDSLKQTQMKMMNLLSSAGIEVELLRVEYVLNPEQIYTVVDLETTGGKAEWDRITEIGAVKIQGNKVLDRFQSLVNPGRSIPRFIQELTGITNEMVEEAPRFEEVAEAFRVFSEGSIFVAHNVNFDYKFLQKEFERLEVRFVRPYLCTKNLMRKHFPKLESYGLAALTKHFNISLSNHHRALCDAEAAAELLKLINGKRFHIPETCSPKDS